MSLFSALHTASTALAAFSGALDVESQNVSNAATQGYAAQRASIYPIDNAGSSGGSDLVQISSTSDARADALVQAASSQAGWSGTQVSQLSPINSTFDITGASGVLAAFQQFSSAFANLGANPNDQTLRSIALTAAGQAATAFQTTANALTSQQAQTNGDIQNTVSQINSLASQIQQINAATDSGEGVSSASNANLRNALDQLSSLVDVTVQTNANGTVNVLAAGQIPLVLGDQSYALGANLSAAPGSQLTSTGWNGSTGTVGGQLGSFLQVKNSTLSSLIGGNGQQGSLNTLAQSFADSVNTLLTSGQTAGGAAGTPLFSYDATNGGVNVAASLAVIPSVTPSQLALASPTQANGVANSLAQLTSSSNPAYQIGGVSLNDYYGSIAAGVGQQLSTATTQSSADQTNLTSAQAARQQQSGVSLDTEAINITADQRAYEASARLVSIIDTLTGEEMDIIK